MVIAKKFVTFDPVTGFIGPQYEQVADEINIARLVEYYPHRLEVGREITEDEFVLYPARWWRVDPKTKRLVDLSDIELRQAHGLTESAALPRRPSMTERGRG